MSGATIHQRPHFPIICLFNLLRRYEAVCKVNRYSKSTRLRKDSHSTHFDLELPSALVSLPQPAKPLSNNMYEMCNTCLTEIYIYILYHAHVGNAGIYSPFLAQRMHEADDDKINCLFSALMRLLQPALSSRLLLSTSESVRISSVFFSRLFSNAAPPLVCYECCLPLEAKRTSCTQSRETISRTCFCLSFDIKQQRKKRKITEASTRNNVIRCHRVDVVYFNDIFFLRFLSTAAVATDGWLVATSTSLAYYNLVTNL